jgi:glucose-1-phosphate adenylyltransferase
VHLHSYSLVEDSIVMQGTEVGRNAVVRRAILDKDVKVAPARRSASSPEADRERFTVSSRRSW